VIKKTLFYILIFVVSFSVFLISTLPASLLWEKVLQQELKNSVAGLDVSSVRGTVWQGEALVRYKSLAMVVDWDVELSGLFAFTLPTSIEINGQAGSISLSVVLGLSQVALMVDKAEIELSHLTPLVKSKRVSLDGKLILKDILLLVEGQQIVSLSGVGSWTGGDIAYPAGRQLHERNLPVFKMLAETNDDGLVHVGVRDSDANFDVIDVSLDKTGEAMVKVARRLLDLADEEWPKNSKETDIVFKVKKVIY